METTHTVPITKIDDERRLFGGWAYVARDAEGNVVTDHSGDFVKSDEAWEVLKDAATAYAVDVRAGDDMHSVFNVSQLAEFVVLDDEKRAQMGITGGPERAVWMTFRADDTPHGDILWGKVKRGEVSALSIVGSGRRETVDA
jgi:hypothetical protein